MSFDPVKSLMQLMKDYPHPWFVSGGWVIDLAAGRETRMRPPPGIAIFREHHEAIREWLTGWTLIADMGYVKEEWQPGEPLNPAVRFVSGRRSEGDPKRLPILIENMGNGLWHCPGSPVITLPQSGYERWTGEAIPYVSPAVHLLTRAADPEPDDERDFGVALMAMGMQDRLWLDRALSLSHPAHPWRESLSPPRPPAPPPPPDTSEE